MSDQSLASVHAETLALHAGWRADSHSGPKRADYASSFPYTGTPKTS